MSEKDENLTFWGLCFAASCLLAVLKIADMGDYSWWIVALPVLVPLGILLLAFLVVIIIFGTFTRRRR